MVKGSRRPSSMHSHVFHDLLHKAAGWMLRETWKKGYVMQLRDFLESNVEAMPSIMLSYACEKMSITERHEWQAKRKKNILKINV